MHPIQRYGLAVKDHFFNKKVLLRVDFNVPRKNGVVTDISRIRNAAPTINFLKEAGAKIILISHLGKTSSFNQNQSLKVLVGHIAEEFKSNVIFVDDCLSSDATQIIDSSAKNDIILLENLRFYPEEEACDAVFAQKLAKLADFYVNEAFSVSHRRHASICELPKLLPSALGLSFVNEIKTIDDFLNKSHSPAMCIIGGSKLSTKVKLLKNLVCKVDKLALGGGIAGAFLGFFGHTSLKIFNQKEHEKDVEEILENAKKHSCELIMPVDFSALISDAESFEQAIISFEQNNASVFDIGPKTVDLFRKHLNESSIVLWNGPLGLFELSPFDFGTRSVAEEIANLTRNKKIISIVGGGDTSYAINKFGFSKDLSYQSTSGGAFLTYLEGGELYGLPLDAIR